MLVKRCMCVLFMILVIGTSTGNAIPSRCNVITPSGIDIICPNANLTSLPNVDLRRTYTLNLRQNRIQAIHDFSGLQMVHSLCLSQNLITTISWESLSNAKFLVKLDLSYNLLTSVRLDLVIGEMKHLVAVDLSHNKLATFSEAHLGRPIAIRQGWKNRGSRRILGNPIHCDCHMFWLATMAREFHQCWPIKCSNAVKETLMFHEFATKGAPKCNSPENLAGVLIHMANLTDCHTKQDGEIRAETTEKILLISEKTSNDLSTTDKIILISEKTRNGLSTASNLLATSASPNLAVYDSYQSTNNGRVGQKGSEMAGLINLLATASVGVAFVAAAFAWWHGLL